ncbi:Hypothetical predicted protein [Octopus vulgaris]|uniref:Uncharacterized protein n=1 Tax=Octopus vulgaris TaxID=6645 RepID=A0AA36AYE2_OCTVU|nr:Hypothetical predicted protein [Octopus vulgaris]
MQPHIANTKVTTVQAHEEREKVLNAHMMMWTIVLGPQKRTAKNFQAWNNDIPALYGLRKDHKGFTDPIAGPPTRPVCGANIASNYRISYFLSMIIRPIIRMSPDVCDSTEDLLSRISDCNKTCDLTGCIETRKVSHPQDSVMKSQVITSDIKSSFALVSDRVSISLSLNVYHYSYNNSHCEEINSKSSKTKLYKLCKAIT